MKRYIVLLFAALSVAAASAQSSAVKKAANSVFTLTTYNQDGSVKATTRGVFVGNEGEAVSSWTPFVGASSAVATDAKGQKHDVSALIGANELYDVCKFRVDGKTTALRPTTNGAAKGSKVWVVNTANGKPQATQIEVERNEKFMNKYSYYIFANKVADENEGCPVVDANGQLLAIVQNSQAGDDTHATDVAFIDSVKTTGLSISDAVLRQSRIRVDLPRDREQATLLLMMVSEQTDSLHYAQYVDEYVRLYPDATYGYTARASSKIAAGDYEGAKQEMANAAKNSSNKAEAHAEWSRLMYQKLVLTPDTTFSAWTLDDAMAEAQKAYAIDPQPVYKHREAQIVFSKGDYSKAYDMFIELTKTDLRNGELYYEAAQSKSMLKAPTSEVIELLDSAISASPQPLTNIAAPYVLSRGQLLDNNGEYRKAMKDYNLYDSLMVGRASDSFYYTRYQCELKLKQYQQALNDVAHAAFINPREPLYLAELASLQLRVNRCEDAVKAADLCLQIAPESTDAYIIKGVALMQLKKKEEGMQALNKAKEMGDTRADELIKKYK